MSRASTVLRISFGLVLLTISILLGLDLLGFLPEKDQTAAYESRASLCEALSTRVSASLERNDYEGARVALEGAVLREPDVLSAGVRSRSGRQLLVTAEHRQLWQPAQPEGSTITHVRVPVFRNGEHTSTIEVRLAELEGASGIYAAVFERPLLRLVLVVGILGFISYAFYMRRTLRHLDPSLVIPTRVQAALDVMTEGVLLIDKHEQIVLVNESLAERLERTGQSLLGAKASSLDWRTADGNEPTRLPWVVALTKARPSEGIRLSFSPRRGAPHAFIVNAAPVLDVDGSSKGAVATFSDVTELEYKTRALEQAMGELEKSRDEVRLQNEELSFLARTDPLTGIANRRAFLETSRALFHAAAASGSSVACLMADIDHFKRINDSQGHSAGDRIIELAADLMASVVGSRETVCRYGGEEFCILLPDATSRDAAQIAERIRSEIGSDGFAEVPVTVSVGVAAFPGSRASDLNELINQADEALYAAKAAGRDQVVRWEVVHA